MIFHELGNCGTNWLIRWPSITTHNPKWVVFDLIWVLLSSHSFQLSQPESFQFLVFQSVKLLLIKKKSLSSSFLCCLSKPKTPKLCCKECLSYSLFLNSSSWYQFFIFCLAVLVLLSTSNSLLFALYFDIYIPLFCCCANLKISSSGFI